jgi:hypothetical protein
MNKSTLLLLLGLFIVRNAITQIELKKDKLAFHELVEWNGVLVVAEDPKEKVDYKELSLISPTGEVRWRKLIYPKSSSSYLIESSSSDYIYYIDDLEPTNNAIRYNQINQSGSVTSTKLDVLNIIRDYGYRTPDEVKIENIVNTPSSLVFHLTLSVSDKDIIENFFVSITHHNNRVYHWKAPETHPDLIKEGKEGPVLYAGCDEQVIYFARYTFQANNHRINFIPIDSKAKPLNAYNYSLPDFDPIISTQKIYANEGRYYLDIENGDSREVRGIPVYIDNKYLYVVNDSKSRSMKVYGANENGDIDVLKSTTELSDESRKYSASIGVSREKSEVTFCGNIEGKRGSLHYTKDQFVSIDLSESKIDVLRNNQSIKEVDNNSTTFVYPLSGEWYGISKSDLPQSEIITFEKQ